MDQNRELLLSASTNIILILMMAIYKKRKSKNRQRRHRIWVKNWIKRRTEGRGLLTMLNDELLNEDPASYKNFLRMDNNCFENLLDKVKFKLTKQDTVMRDSITARSKLEITLRFLATGECYRSLMYSTRISESAISRFVPIVCDIIYHSLRDEYLKTPDNQNSWLKIAEQFEEMWQFPNCLGALDGRHIKFRAPVSAGSFYHNYKGTHSIVLLGLADAQYKFTYYNVGVNGRISDGGVFRESGLCRALANDSLNLPSDQTLPGQTSKTPFVLLADDAFPLSKRIMKPFPCRGLSQEQKIFNYRLSRGRRLIESVFGILANRFRVLLNPIQLAPDKVEKITLACVALHNLLATENWKSYTELSEEEEINHLPNIGPQCGNRSTVIALQVRENFKNYFNSEYGAVEWQSNAVLRHNM